MTTTYLILMCLLTTSIAIIGIIDMKLMMKTDENRNIKRENRRLRVELEAHQICREQEKESKSRIEIENIKLKPVLFIKGNRHEPSQSS